MRAIRLTIRIGRSACRRRTAARPPRCRWPPVPVRMYCRVCSRAAEPAGRGPNATTWRTCSYARAPSKRRLRPGLAMRGGPSTARPGRAPSAAVRRIGGSSAGSPAHAVPPSPSEQRGHRSLQTAATRVPAPRRHAVLLVVMSSLVDRSPAPGSSPFDPSARGRAACSARCRTAARRRGPTGRLARQYAARALGHAGADYSCDRRGRARPEPARLTATVPSRHDAPLRHDDDAVADVVAVAVGLLDARLVGQPHARGRCARSCPR